MPQKSEIGAMIIALIMVGVFITKLVEERVSEKQRFEVKQRSHWVLLRTSDALTRVLYSEDPPSELTFPEDIKQWEGYASLLDELAMSNPVQSEHDQIVDGWGRPVVYETFDDGRGFRVYSRGPNGVDEGGTGEDIVERFWMNPDEEPAEAARNPARRTYAAGE